MIESETELTVEVGFTPGCLVLILAVVACVSGLVVWLVLR